MQDDPQDAATEAFEALRAEVTQLRAGIEGLSAKFQGQDPTDYAPTLGAIAMSLEAIERHPALQADPETYARQSQEANELSAKQRQADLETAVKRGLIVGEYRSRKHHKELVIGVVLAAIVGAFMWTIFSGSIFHRLFPNWNLPERMAAATLGLDRWAAGAKLMEGANPQEWARLVDAVDLERANRQVLDKCRTTAVRTGKSQRCTVVLKVL